MTSVTDEGVEHIADTIRAARARNEPLCIVGAGTWLDAGRPRADAARLDVSSLAGITRYEPGDLVLSARAGTSLADIAAATREHGQWLALDPPGSADGTIGATVATASYGPLASAFGTPRDHLLGCEFVTGSGDIVRGGGQVVKNVAGFDLVRLVTGAWGTLGPITEVTVRLRARPEVDRTLAVALDAEPAETLWRWLRESEFTPLAAELLSPSLAAALAVGNGTVALIRLGGNETFVRAARDAVGTLGLAHEVPSSVWDRFARAESASSLAVRVSALPSYADSLWRRALEFVEATGGYAHATCARGVVRCVAPSDGVDIDVLRAALLRFADGVSIVGERMPAHLWSALPSARSTRDLEARIRTAFDPAHILNSGVLGT
ncbi:MAG TPA: FAD-binding protein [Gemmatimonadaceae bacterium]